MIRQITISIKIGETRIQWFCLFNLFWLLFLSIDANGAVEKDSRDYLFLTELIDHEDMSIGNSYQYAGTQMRRVLLSPSTSLPTVNSVSDEGIVHLIPSKHLPPLDRHSLGMRLMFEYFDGPVSLFSSARKGFEFIPRSFYEEDLLLTLRPPGLPQGNVRLWTRQIISPEQRLVSRSFQVPSYGRLDFAIALQHDWRIPKDVCMCFRIYVIHQEKSFPVFEEILCHSTSSDLSGWFERNVDISHFSGQIISLVFETEDCSVTENPENKFAFPLWANPVIFSDVPDITHPALNVIFIALDTLRADRLGCYGYHRMTSPNIDRFAEESVLFEWAIAPAPWTTPSFASIFTGMNPSRHQAGVFSKGFRLSERFTTLADLFKQAGRITGAYTEGVAVRAHLGFCKGFDVYCDGITPESHETGTAERTFRRAAHWLEYYGHLPFFLFVQTYECHDPYTPPEPWDLMFADMQYQGNVGGMPALATTEEDRRHLSDRYDGGIAYTDHWVGWFLERLNALQLADTTLVVLFSDHGEELWEHGGFGHTSHLYDEVLCVPLIIRMPKGGQQFLRISQQVSITDIFATVLEFIEVPVGDGLDSYSLLPLIDPLRSDSYVRPDVISELSYFEKNGTEAWRHPIEWRMRSVRYPDKKYVISNKPVDGTLVQDISKAVSTEYLYDLIMDPGEQVNIVEDSRTLATEMKLELLEFLGAVDPLADISEIPTVQVDSLREEDVQSLKSMGYL